MEKQKIRYNWLDVFKCFSIFFILYAHLGAQGNLAPYVFSFMVHCFFFAGGVTAQRSNGKPMSLFIKQKFSRLMIPYFVYGIVNIVLSFLIDPPELQLPLRSYVFQLLYGYRLKLFAVTLWFLPCLFILSILYHFISAHLSNKWVRFGVCIGISFIFRLFSEGNTLPWGIDNAVRFLIYYAAGDFFADTLNTLSQKPRLFFTWKWPVVLTLISIGLSYLQYQYGLTYLVELAGLPTSYLVLFLTGAFYAFNGIFLFSMISIALQDVPQLQLGGQHSLIICCLQRPLDRFVYAIAAFLGLQLDTTATASALILTTIFIVLGVKAGKFIKTYLGWSIGISKSK